MPELSSLGDHVPVYDGSWAEWDGHQNFLSTPPKPSASYCAHQRHATAAKQ